MISLALIGKNIAHSRSQITYESILGKPISYDLIDCEDESLLPSLESLFAKGYKGVSITAPYKKYYAKSVTIDSDVEELGIINCLKEVDGQFFATNTDYLACLDILKKLIDSKEKKVVILGSGSMSSIVKKSLDVLGFHWEQYSRKKNGALENMDLSKNADIVINCCARSFKFSGKLASGCVFWDMNYAHDFHEKKIPDYCRYESGDGLLREQAIHALDFWGVAR